MNLTLTSGLGLVLGGAAIALILLASARWRRRRGGDWRRLASATLEAARRTYGITDLVDAQTAAQVRGSRILREIDLFQLDAQDEPVRIFELMSPVGAASDTQLALREHYEAGLEAYRSRRWKEATGELRACLEIVPDDGPTRTLLARIEALTRADPGPEWDGVWHPQGERR